MLLTIISIVLLIIASTLLYTDGWHDKPQKGSASAEQDSQTYSVPIGETGRLAQLVRDGDGTDTNWKAVLDEYVSGKPNQPILGFGPSAKFQRDHPDNPDNGSK